MGQFHAQKIKSHPEAELVGVCDFSYQQAQKVAADLSVQAYQKPEELFNKVDYVHIAASTQAHYQLVTLFLQQKIPVFVEKPIAATVEQAKKLCQLSAQNNTLLTVGHIERFNPAFQYLKENRENINYLEINRLAPFRSRGSDVSVLHDLTIHDIDLINWIFLRSAKGSTEDYIEDYEISGSKLIKPTYDDVSIRLKLKSGMQITVNNSRVTPQIVRNYRAVTPQQVIFMNTVTLEAEILKPRDIEPYHVIDKIQLTKVDALALEVDHFIQCIQGKKELAITAVEATEALKNIEKFILKLEASKA